MECSVPAGVKLEASLVASWLASKRIQMLLQSQPLIVLCDESAKLGVRSYYSAC